MTRKSTGKPQGEIKRSTLQMPRKDVENRIQGQIEEGKRFLQLQIDNRFELDKAEKDRRKWSDYNEYLLKSIVGTEDLVRDYRNIPPRGWGLSGVGPLGPSFSEKVNNFFSDVNEQVNQLESILGFLELIPESTDLIQSDKFQGTQNLELNDKIFVVHGHDEEAKQSVARCIEKLGLTAIILHEQADKGRTTIEKLESYANVGFAVILLTPDDIGASKGEEDKLQPRARQNVILELGYFLGRLKRDKVCALYKGDVEIPSDFSGVLWTRMDENEAWRLRLAMEMKEAGLNVDLNKLA